MSVYDGPTGRSYWVGPRSMQAITREVLLYVLGTRRKESRELSSRSRNVKKCCSALRFT